MKSFWWILIVIAILLITVVVLLVVGLTKASKLAKLINEILVDAKIINYCYIDEKTLLSIFNEAELQQNKFVTRPFICITSPYLKKYNSFLVIPQRTNRKTKIYPLDIYLSNGAYKLVPQNLFFVSTKSVDLRSNYANKAEHKIRLEEIKAKQDQILHSVIYVLKHQPDLLDLIY